MRSETLGHYEGYPVGAHPLLGKSYADFERTSEGKIKYSYGKLGLVPTEVKYLEPQDAILVLAQVLENGFERIEQAKNNKAEVMNWLNN